MAVELKVATGGPHFVMTFGRVQDVVDPTELESIVLEHAASFGLSQATEATVCWSLRDARGAPYFYEALIDFAADLAVARGQDHEHWRNQTDQEMRAGHHLWYLGDPSRAS